MKMQRLENRDQRSRLHLVRKPVASADVAVVREGSTGRVVVMMPPVLPRVWAVAEPEGCTASGPTHDDRAVKDGAPFLQAHVPKCEGHGAPTGVAEVEVAFYRKYTEAMLRRYLKLSMAAGRVPSLMGRELFRGHVTSYRVHSFEDVVIFCYDVEKCLSRLDERERELIKRIALQSYTQAEAAAILGLSLRSCVQQYMRTLDRLTKMLLKSGMLEPLKGCQ